MNFFQKIVKKLAQQVFKPVPLGLLYTTLQCISREISGDCPWDNGTECDRWRKDTDEYVGLAPGLGYLSEPYISNWQSGGCRNSLCPGYLYPTGLISYTSRAPTLIGTILASSFDNVFDYSSFRQYSSLIDPITGLRIDEVSVGTYGAKIKINFDVSGRNVHIGDKWTIACTASTGVVGNPIADAANSGTYGVVESIGIYTGKFDTVYTVTITDFWGYNQDYNNALLQICLLTATDYWLDYWGSYFGIPRILLFAGYESDDVYRARIMKEITLPRTTKAVLLQLSKDYLGSDKTTITEYEYPAAPGWDAQNSNGLMPYEFYVNMPYQDRPSSLFVKAGTTNFLIAGSKCYSFDVATSVFTPLNSVGLGSIFPAVPETGDAFLIGNTCPFSGIESILSVHGTTGGDFEFEYWNGSTWVVFIPNDLTSAFSSDGSIHWSIYNNWDDWVLDDNKIDNIPNSGTNLYWIRIRIVTPPAPYTNLPVATSTSIIYAGATCRGHYCGSWATYDPTKRDIIDTLPIYENNCYVYDTSVFANQGQYSGLQQIIDRNKAAGTICIINV